MLWVGSATDAKFSLIPRDVSAGEFTWVVQRVPVRIWFEPDERFGELRPGLSVTAGIEHGPGDPAWAKATLDEEARLEQLRTTLAVAAQAEAASAKTSIAPTMVRRRPKRSRKNAVDAMPVALPSSQAPMIQ